MLTFLQGLSKTVGMKYSYLANRKHSSDNSKQHIFEFGRSFELL